MSTRKLSRWCRARGLGLALTGGAMFQLGGCNFDQITTTSTLDGREVLISLIRSAILTPIDAAITTAVNNLFDAEEN